VTPYLRYDVTYLILEIFLLENVRMNNDCPNEEDRSFLGKLLLFYQTTQCHIIEVMNFNYLRQNFKFRTPRCYLPARLLYLSPSLSPEGPVDQHKTPLTATAEGHSVTVNSQTHIFT
jgi:hypothetical protein